MKDRSGQRVTRARLKADLLDWILFEAFFCRLSRGEVDALLPYLRWEGYERSRVLIQEGRPVDGMDIIVSGEVRVERRDPESGEVRPVTRLGPGHVVGETSLYRAWVASPDSPWPEAVANATVRTLSRTETLHLPGDRFAEAIEALAPFRRVIAELVELRERWDEVLATARLDAELRRLGSEDLERLVQTGVIERYAAGATVIREGADGREVYLVLEGSLAVSRSASDGRGREQLGHKERGDLFGEVAIVCNEPRTADVVARTPVALVRFPAGVMSAIIDLNATVANSFQQRFARQDLRFPDRFRRAAASRVVAVLGAADGLGTTTLAYGLAQALAEDGKVTLVDLDRLATGRELRCGVRRATVAGVAVGVPDAAARWDFRVVWPRRPSDLPRLLERLGEEDGNVVIAGGSDQEENRDVLERADAVVFVQRADTPELQESLQRHHHRVDAIRLGGDAILYLETSERAVRVPDDAATAGRFYVAGDPTRLVDEDEPLGRACRRLVRALRRQTVGLALGGGGALGYAHVGLLRALAEAGIPVDLLSGTSFGALVAGVYAAEGQDGLRRIVDEHRWVFRAVVGAIVHTGTVELYLRHIVGSRSMAHTEIPFYPVAANASTGGQVVRTAGTVGRGVRSSSVMPGLYRPLTEGKLRLLDGGMYDNVPAIIASRGGAHFVLASNAVSSFPFTSEPLGWMRWIPLVERADLLMRAVYLLLSRTGRDRARSADFTFQPDLRDFTATSFLRAEAIVEAGYHEATRVMPDIRAAYENRCGIPAAPKKEVAKAG